MKKKKCFHFSKHIPGYSEKSLKRKVSADEMLTIDFVQISLAEKGFLVQLYTADLIQI